MQVSLVKLLLGIVDGNIELLYPARRNLEHGIHHHRLHDRAEATCAKLVLYGLVNDEVESLVSECKLYAIHLEELDILLDNGVLGLHKDAPKCLAVEWLEIGESRQTANNLGYKPERLKVLRKDILHKVFLVDIAYVLY